MCYMYYLNIFNSSRDVILLFIDHIYQARQTRPNSGGVAKGHLRFDKGGVAIIFTFYALKI